MIQHEKTNRKECGEELMLYLHIPFCVQKCRYCDFLSGAYDRTVRERYLRALAGEIRERSREVGGLKRRVSSIFIGGGTPSVLEAEEIGELMKEIRSCFCVTEDAEITMECNPGTVDGEKLSGFHEAGINRLSIGLQSGNNRELELLGRIHTYETFLETYQNAWKAGFRNLNVDLMNALPGQTLESWKDTMEKVLALVPAPQHIAVYSLILEEGTIFYGMLQRGEFSGEYAIPTEEADREMYAYTGKRLREAGYHQYEISNYAAEHYECRHNCGYWTRKEYLGLGIGAASLIGNKRHSNTRDMEQYLNNPLEGRETETLSSREEMEEFMFLGLRMNRGVDRQDFVKQFDISPDEIYSGVIEKNVRDGLLADDGRAIALTAKGRDLSNYVMAQFLLDEP
ncbi:MAG: oxygen-independent coproporphyrinogen III oxidase [Lachnospiraceae bacterium]|nr:oxygen-independent coproporphyrinogen III oxidase [Lachnospiraceae bacterium]